MKRMYFILGFNLCNLILAVAHKYFCPEGLNDGTVWLVGFSFCLTVLFVWVLERIEQ